MLGDPPRGPGRVNEPSGWSGMGSWMLLVDRDGSGHPPRGAAQVVGPSGRSVMGWGTLP